MELTPTLTNDALASLQPADGEGNAARPPNALTDTASSGIPTDPSTVSSPNAAPAASDASPLPQLIRIDPPAGWQLINVRELWKYRELLFFLTWRDVKVRYKQTVLGAAWAILQPVMMMVVFTIFFGHLAKVPAGKLPYPLFVLAGLLPWTFFSTAISSAGNSVVGSERLITKIYFPRLAIPFAAVGAAIVDFAISLSVLVLMLLYYALRGAPVHATPALLLIPVIFALIVLAAVGIGTLLAALNVAYRDFKYVIPFMVQLWLFATPTIYMQAFDTAGPTTRLLLLLNPMSGLIGAFRAAVLGTPLPWRHLALAAVCCALVFLIGCLYFRKVEDSFADLI